MELEGIKGDLRAIDAKLDALIMVAYIPLLAEEGRLRHQKNVAKPPKRRRRVVRPAQRFAEPRMPSTHTSQ